DAALPSALSPVTLPLAALHGRVDSQDLPGELIRVLGGFGRRAAVAGSDEEKLLGAELQLAAVVVGGVVRMGDEQHQPGRGAEGAQPGFLLALELPDLVVARLVGEV